MNGQMFWALIFTRERRAKRAMNEFIQSADKMLTMLEEIAAKQIKFLLLQNLVLARCLIAHGGQTFC